MIRGSTQNLVFNIGINTEEVSQLWLTFSHSNRLNAEIFTKEKNDVILDGASITVPLSQEETLALNEYNIKEKVVYIQLRVLLEDGQSRVSKVVEITVEHLLKDGVLS